MKLGPTLIAAGSPAVAPLFIELGIIFLLLAILGRLAARVGVSPIPLFLVAGMAFGAEGVLPVEFSKEFIEAGAEIGVVLLLFMLGLEYTGSELAVNMRKSMRAGLLDFGMNFTPGVIFGLVLGWGVVPALLLGGITYISSSGIISKLLNDVGWLGNRETPVILSTLIFEDLVMAVYLPLMTVLLVGAGIASGMVSLGIAMATVAVLGVLALRLSEPISKFVSHRSDEITLLAVLGVMLLVGGVAQRLEVSAAVGAFLFGIALSKSVSEHVHHLMTPLKDMFAAVFFVFFGLQISPSSLPAALPIALLLALITGATKITSAIISAKMAGVSWRGRMRAASMLITRGEFSIVIAGLAAGATTFDYTVLISLTAAYVLIMAIAGPVAVKFIMPVMDWIDDRRAARNMSPLGTVETPAVVVPNTDNPSQSTGVVRTVDSGNTSS
jgi:CPA2 family monovalent cation:H+ antiporter-2